MQSWDRLVAALAGENLGLRPGVTSAKLTAAEERLGPLPPDYREWLTITDGQESDSVSLLPTNGVFIPLARVVEQWSLERGFDSDDDGGDTYQDDDRVRWLVYHPGRVTIAGNYFLDGDNTVLDRWPGPAGVPGQVISSTSEVDFVVLAPSLDDYFARLADLIGLGALVVRDRPHHLRGLAHPDTDESWEDLLRP